VLQYRWLPTVSESEEYSLLFSPLSLLFLFFMIYSEYGGKHHPAE
jgi:hypothetical protein